MIDQHSACSSRSKSDQSAGHKFHTEFYTVKMLTLFWFCSNQYPGLRTAMM